MCVCVSVSVCVGMCLGSVGAHGGQEKAFNPKELELEVGYELSNMGAGN